MLTHENVLEIVKVLKDDPVLVAMLAENPPYYQPDAPKAKANSIVPTDFIPELKNMPAIGVRAGVTTRRGVSMIDAIILVRCYNNMDKAFVDINKVLSRVETLVNGKLFELTGMVNIATTFETISQESVDDAYQLRFREAAFRLQLI
jgi:hypothetical protein